MTGSEAIQSVQFVTVEGKHSGGKSIDQGELAKQALRLPGIESAKIITGGYDYWRIVNWAEVVGGI